MIYINKWIFRLKLCVIFTKKMSFIRTEKILWKNWFNRFCTLCDNGDARTEELIYEFFNCSMKRISKIKTHVKNQYAPTLFCVIKNDREKIELFMAHYRKLGIEKFVFLDNKSSDGTREYLLRQRDVILYESGQEYSSAKRVSWLNRMLAKHGENRWCLVVDSDELLNYIGSEKYNLNDLINIAQKRGYKRIEGFMLDMYSDKNLFQKTYLNNFIEDNIYFDKDSYSLENSPFGLTVRGGPRKRLFYRNMQLSKYPLFYFGKDDIMASSHYMYPIYPIKECPMWLVLSHYKFVDEKDMQKIRIAVKKENYAGGSADYKAYIDKISKKKNISFYNPNLSEKLDNSSKLKSIKFLKEPFELC